MKKKKWLARSAVVAALLIVATITAVVSVRALGFEDYYVTEGNSFRVTIKQNKASSSATVKYSTAGWYLFPKEIKAYDNSTVDTRDYPGYSTINASFYSGAGFHLSTSTNNRVDRQELGSFYYDTYEWSAETMLSAMQKWIKAGQLDRKQLSNGITLYASRPLTIKKNNNPIGTVYSYPEMVSFSKANGIDWSSKSWDTFYEETYDQLIHVSFQNVGISYQVVDENGESLDKLHNGITGFAYPDVYYGETITTNSPGKIMGYEYVGWELSAGSFKITGSTPSINYTASFDDINGNDLVLTFKYKTADADMPFQSPTPEPTQAPGATATPTPTPTVTPTPAPPTPTSQPTENTYTEDSEVRYFSTDKGYHIAAIADSSTYYLASEAAGTGGGYISGSSHIYRNNSYSIGTDSNGNQWYFEADGTNATYVHPAVYNGYAVESEDIKYITELVFPSTITYGGISYTVRTIGGGTARYKSDESSPGTGTTTYDYSATSGYHYYGLFNSNTSQTTDISRTVAYAYGVLGNGYITSEGRRAYYYHISGGRTVWENERSYYVYNTTLKKVVIPDTVTTIAEGAFRYCQALETIEGGANVSNIDAYAFRVEGFPKISLSRNSTQGTETIKNYYYYNDDYSLTAYTNTMLAWRDVSFLSDEMIFPYLPKLTYIGTYAFGDHHNIDEADLSETVTNIMAGAFSNCNLDRIRIPNASCFISDEGTSGVYTLGTKGYDETGNATQIHCEPDSTAMSYGLKYDGYYVLYCGYPVTYEPNGAPGTAQEVYSALNVHYGTIDDENGIRLTYPNYKQSWSNQYLYSSSDCQYQSYLDPDGVLWQLDTTSKTMTQVSAGTTFMELFQEGSAHYAKDSAGNLWVSGQQQGRSTYTDSWGDLSFYSYYGDWFSWRKITLPANTVKTQFTDLGVFALDSNGVVWWCQIASQSNRQVTDNALAFVDFCYVSYSGDADYSINSYLAGIDADGTLYRSRKEYTSGYYTTGFTLGAYLYENNFYTATTTGGKEVVAVQYSYLSGINISNVVLNASGDLKLYHGSTELQNITGYGFTEMEPYTVFGSAGALLKDAAGNTYLAGMTTSNSLRIMKVASAGDGIKEVWTERVYFSSSSSYGCEWEDERYYHDRMYVWTDDGYLTAHSGETKTTDGYSPSYMSNTSWSPASVKFKKILHGYHSIFAIAEDGTLWTGGNNQYGLLGDSNKNGYSYDYEYPAGKTSCYLTQTSSRTYADTYISSRYSIALGTDGRIYYSGYKPLASYDGSYSDGSVNAFTALGSEYTWPATGTLPRLRTGFDYDTVIVNNPFSYSGYEFKGWNTATGGTGTAYFPGDAVELDSAMTVYAQWGRSNNIIIYDANGGYGTMAPTVLDYSVTSTILCPNNFKKEGYKFSYWCRTMSNCPGADASGHQHYTDGAQITGVSGTVTLYAQWEAEEYISNTFFYTLVYMTYPYGTAGNTAWKTKTLSYETVETVEGQPYTPASGYTVTYNINTPSGMSTVPTALSKTSDSIGALTFNKWRLYRRNASGEYVYAGTQYAQGSTLSKLTQEKGAVVYLYPSWNTVGAYVVLPYTEADGYVFEGWSETADGSSMVYPVYPPEDEENIGTFTPVKNTTLYAYWIPKQYTVTLNDCGATSSSHTGTVIMTFDKKGADITVPTKTGYTFHGYYTGTRGTGTKYYDASGICVKAWTEDGKNTLYAYWIQDGIDLPDISDRTDPTPLPEMDVEGSVNRNDGKALLYADDYNSSTGALTDLQPYLTYDTPSSKGAIPGTELISIRAKMGAWMLTYKFHRYTGTDYVRIYVTVPYRTQYERSSDAELMISARQTKTYSFEVPKVWSYWEVTESSMYYPDKITITNEAIKGGSVTVNVDRTGTDAVVVPYYEVTSYGEKANHVSWPEYDADGTPVLRITLTEEQYIISNVPDTLPDIDSHLTIVCENAAWADTRQASTKSDKYVFDGVTVLSDVVNTDGNGADLLEDNLPNHADAELIEFTSYVQTYASGVELDERKPNGTYSTTATITYAGDAANVGAEATRELVLTDINDLNIHTPVACKGIVVDGIEEESGVYTLTLKDALNFFTLRIDNTGAHRMSLGYGTKDFALALSGKSNVAVKDGTMLNQVKFAFDVYVDEGNNSLKADGTYDTEGDYLFEADTWLTIGKEEQRFFVPVTMENGNFEVEFRTIAVNCPVEAAGEYCVSSTVQNGTNIDGVNYVAADSMELEIKSYLKDFIITGTNDLAAKKQLQAGNQALTLKKGYEFSFHLLTQGEFYGESAEFEVVPKFYWESAEGTERQEVKLYHMTELPYEEWKECYEWEGVPLLVQNENYDVILQCWGGSGMVPADVLCVAEEDIILLEEYISTQTITGKEAFFKRNGFLIIQLEIRVRSNKNVWYIFNKWMSTKLAEDALEAGWNYIPGEVIRYDLSQSVKDDYEVGGVE